VNGKAPSYGFRPEPTAGHGTGRRATSPSADFLVVMLARKYRDGSNTEAALAVDRAVPASDWLDACLKARKPALAQRARSAYASGRA